MSESKPYLGIGWDFPPRFNTKRGEAFMTTDIEDIEKSLQIIVTTRPGERIMRPSFGCDISDKVFENLNSTQIHSIKTTIEEAILLYESRIIVQKIGLDIQNLLDGKLLIKVDYIVRTTNNRRNIVFPYYITEATDI